MAIDLFGKKKRAKKAALRSEGFQRYADVNDWKPVPENLIKTVLKSGRLGRVDGKVNNAFTKRQNGEDFYFFDYIYYFYNGQAHQKLEQTVLICVRKNNLPKFNIYPKSFLHHIWDAITFAKSRRKKGQEYLQHYVVKSKADPKVLNSTFKSAFKHQIIKDEKVHLESNGNTLFFYRNNQICLPNSVDSSIRFFMKLVENLN